MGTEIFLKMMHLKLMHFENHCYSLFQVFSTMLLLKVTQNGRVCNLIKTLQQIVKSYSHTGTLKGIHFSASMDKFTKKLFFYANLIVCFTV